MKYIMGIDCGGTVLKASIFDLEGREMSSYGETMDVITPQADWYERDTAQTKKCAYAAIKGALEKAGVDGADIAGIGVTGQANGLYMFKKDGTPTYNAVLSSDMRAKDYIKKWIEDGTQDRLLPILKETLWAGQTPILMTWFANNNPAVLDEADVCITAKDYIRFLLTGKWALEITETTVFSVMDQDTREISDVALEAYGIPQYKGKFPEKILESDEIGGTVTAEAAALTGLAEGIPVVGGLFDCTANTISQGIVKEDQLCIIAGTWGMNDMITKKMIYSDQLFGSYIYYPSDYRQIMEGSSTSCSNLEWFVNTILKQNGMKFCGYGELNRMIAEDAPVKNSIFFLPFMYGSNVNLDAKSAFIGLNGGHGIPDMLRGIYEGVVFGHMYHIDRLLKFVDPPKTVRASGGGAKSDVWMQMFADALGVEIEVSEAEEVGTLGCAMVAGIGAGCFKDVNDAVEKCVHIKKSYKPNMDLHEYYQKKYGIYRKLIDALDPVWGDIDTIAK